ncbi:polymerase [Drepanopeziza brunnea f. sp. 'multigermtubi' MB_m1]|uniref:Polymerase n=1 Tax=Marssonina brunnea f. sp. multigermtubi (strain MB_m1) TaxID=1072389 RepID=K1W4U7_MARBU|nr:polymerase [Drepanopeziza brunnea f. sp. 'multigermtubi' MB_m1]EKD11955.1 polymerase [Drepanopeziza brunnea f. sp. 'multigermtubi' MB_m1]
MRYFDFTKLFDNKAMIIPVTFIKNGLSYKVSALLDSRANKNFKINGVFGHAFYIIAPLTRFINGFISTINFAAELLKLINDLLIFFEYFDYAYVFFKAASNVLALYKLYDYKIELFEEKEKALPYSLLYKMSILKLELTKAYFIDNLNKGFIELLIALFAALVLFAKKQDGSFRFCIDFRALNNLTRKDRYFLFLIDKTFARLLRAKIFTKLDIRQAFYRIRIDLASEKLITFKTRYGAYKSFVKLNYVVYDKKMLAIIRSFSNFRAEFAGSFY